MKEVEKVWGLGQIRALQVWGAIGAIRFATQH